MIKVSVTSPAPACPRPGWNEPLDSVSWTTLCPQHSPGSFSLDGPQCCRDVISILIFLADPRSVLWVSRLHPCLLKDLRWLLLLPSLHPCLLKDPAGSQVAAATFPELPKTQLTTSPCWWCPFPTPAGPRSWWMPLEEPRPWWRENQRRVEGMELLQN